MTTSTANGSRRKARPQPTPVLRFGVNSGSHAREPKDGEYYYRIELVDGREALILAQEITFQSGALIVSTDGDPTVVLTAGTWVSAYVCEALLGWDRWSIPGPPGPRRRGRMTEEDWHDVSFTALTGWSTCTGLLTDDPLRALNIMREAAGLQPLSD